MLRSAGEEIQIGHLRIDGDDMTFVRVLGMRVVHWENILMLWSRCLILGWLRFWLVFGELIELCVTLDVVLASLSDISTRNEALRISGKVGLWLLCP